MILPPDPARADQVAARLGGWLAPRVGARGPVSVAHIGAPPLNGSSNETWVIDATWDGPQGAAQGGFVVRMAPKGRLLYHHYDLDLQYRTMSALAATTIPVPPLVGYEDDLAVLGEPFYVMAKVEGDAPPDLPPFTVAGWVHDASPQVQGELHQAGLEMLARIHRLDPASVALDFLPTGFDDLFARTEDWYRWAAPDGHPVLDLVLDWLRANRPVDPSPDVVNWGDARLGNMLFSQGQPVAVLDWEMAAVVPPEVDLGWWLFLNRHHTDGLGVPRLPGFPSDAQTALRYAAAVGRPVRHLRYFEAFAGFRFGIIVLRAYQAALEDGSMAGQGSGVVDNSCNRMLVNDLGLPAPWA